MLQKTFSWKKTFLRMYEERTTLLENGVDILRYDVQTFTMTVKQICS